MNIAQQDQAMAYAAESMAVLLYGMFADAFALCPPPLRIEAGQKAAARILAVVQLTERGISIENHDAVDSLELAIRNAAEEWEAPCAQS